MFVVPARASAVQQSRAAFEAMSTVPFAAMVCLRQGLRDKSSRPAPPLAGHARAESRRRSRRQARGGWL